MDTIARAADKSEQARRRPPPLEIQSPLCGVCGNEVDYDGDRFSCPNCRANWSRDHLGDAAGHWDDPDAAQCKSVDGRFLPGGQWALSSPSLDIYRCVLDAGHTARSHEYADAVGYVHRSWPDEHSATPAQIAAGVAD